MPQVPYPGTLERARTARDYDEHLADLRVGWKRRRQAFPQRWLEPIVLVVAGAGDMWAEYLSRRMSELGMTKTRLAELAGLTRQTISEWVNGRGASTIKMDNVLRIAAAFGDSPAIALNAAAGIRPSPPERDPEVEMILATDWSEQRKAEMIDRLWRRREEQRQERIANLRFLLGDEDQAN